MSPDVKRRESLVTWTGSRNVWFRSAVFLRGTRATETGFLRVVLNQRRRLLVPRFILKKLIRNCRDSKQTHCLSEKRERLEAFEGHRITFNKRLFSSTIRINNNFIQWSFFFSQYVVNICTLLVSMTLTFLFFFFFFLRYLKGSIKLFSPSATWNCRRKRHGKSWKQ